MVMLMKMMMRMMMMRFATVQWWCYRVDQAGIGNSRHLTTQQRKWLSGFLFCLFAFVFIAADKT